ncbi:MAG TPA: type II toxin-antitoxin system HigB family toxin [Isosphaeraceae bacterium]|nr:type II toxin-antitoxin system HigB family toxin [Isosphaeraceae bacterium]
MHVISRRALREFWEVHADAEEPLRRWFKLATKAKWANFAELKADCPGADRVGDRIVINIGGNKYRLIIEVYFQNQVILVRYVLTRKEYDRGTWKAPDHDQEAIRHGDSSEKATRTESDGKDRRRPPGQR